MMARIDRLTKDFRSDRLLNAALWRGGLAVLTLFAAALAAEETVDEPLPPEEAARTMIVPEGFQVTLFAGEPDVRQPIGFCLDDRGRLWVAEAYNYPTHNVKPASDRILIFEDADGDGRFDKRTVFYDQLNYVTGIEVGFGGAWVVSPPYLYFIPDQDGDDRPDGPPEVLLDGFGTHANSHNLANALAWGPDGWLYGTHGRTNWSLLGKPGTPGNERIRFDGGVYRYHPVRHVWEPYSDGSTNPWGIDWNDVGEAFVCNCVDPHLFHVIQGAHYEPWRNRQSSQFAYERIPSIADHLHFVGQNNVRDGLGSPAEDAAGGGHAHCGTMVYLGDNWPEAYRNTVFMHNIHGKRINNDLPRRQGSGYTASHGRDLLRSRDPWYMGVTLRYGPDGGVYASDWSDTGECHSLKNTRRETGRIFKITYGRPRKPPVDLAGFDSSELVRLQLHRNDWHVQHARRLLQERAARGDDLRDAHHELRRLFAELTDVPRQLRALWALQVTGGLDTAFLLKQLEHSSESVRSWSVRLLLESPPTPDVMRRIRELAERDESPLVRLWLASGLQRLSPGDRWAVAAALLSRSEDAADANLPLMIWYGIEPLVHEDQARFMGLAREAKLPLVRRHIARRAASLEDATAALGELVSVIGAADRDTRYDLLQGLLRGLEGRRSVPMPSGWPAAYAQVKADGDPAALETARHVALVFGDPVALDELRGEARAAGAEAKVRNWAIEALVSQRTEGLAELLLGLIDDPVTQRAALRGLAACDESAVPQSLVERYLTFPAAARGDAVATLASRPAWALALLEAVESGQIPRSDLSAFTARQLLNLKDKRVAERVQALWGAIRPTAAEKTRLITEYRKKLTPQVLDRADRSAGRVLYQQTCANCHKLFDAGGEIGPNITGSQRHNLEYMLENLIDPSGAVARDYQMQIIETRQGRTITGLVVAETPAAVTIQTVNDRVVVPTDEIDNRARSDVSMMPDGLLQKLTFEQVRDLIAYLAGPGQVALPADTDSPASKP